MLSALARLIQPHEPAEIVVSVDVLEVVAVTGVQQVAVAVGVEPGGVLAAAPSQVVVTRRKTQGLRARPDFLRVYLLPIL